MVAMEVVSNDRIVRIRGSNNAYHHPVGDSGGGCYCHIGNGGGYHHIGGCNNPHDIGGNCNSGSNYHITVVRTTINVINVGW